MARSSRARDVSPSEKRIAARELNALFERLQGDDSREKRARRKRRLLIEVREGPRGEPMSLEALALHLDTLLRMGETPETLESNGILRPEASAAERREVLRALQSERELDPRVATLLGAPG